MAGLWKSSRGRRIREFPDFSTGQADYDSPRVSINARLLENFDLSPLPVTYLNGRDDW